MIVWISEISTKASLSTLLANVSMSSNLVRSFIRITTLLVDYCVLVTMASCSTKHKFIYSWVLFVVTIKLIICTELITMVCYRPFSNPLWYMAVDKITVHFYWVSLTICNHVINSNKWSPKLQTLVLSSAPDPYNM